MSKIIKQEGSEKSRKNAVLSKNHRSIREQYKMGSELYIKVGLLISLAVLGWFVGRRFKIDPKDISSILVYVISPFVIFISIIEPPADISFFRYSLAAFILSSSFALLAFLLGRTLWNDRKANLFSFAWGTGNTGYFALRGR
ncbi:AEC family transporter [Endozoicomonas numazuensis]|uniref:Uncharacterized protein n=1 Tax=Endozoicomonas numazuensis TaxID=1137799 RepID=A0A081NJR5_9GAMM|nr:hypothetical protein [Endozoicomonas numazuensis]KEQ18688.1 hypothetical protein GZ78_00775 [Endozoicomonas numazuensis]